MQDPTSALFQVALGLNPPWRVDRIEFDADHRHLDVHLGFPPGARFACPEGDGEWPVHDTVLKRWRHLNFFEHEAYLQARVPRIRCERHGVRQVRVPWARQGSGFTVLFEALVMVLAREMPVRAIARLLGEHDTRIWRVVHFHVAKARLAEDHSGVRRIGVDETSRRRGRHYLSIFVDLDRAKVLFATPGRESTAFEQFRRDLEHHHGRPAALEEICMDMCPPYMLGTEQHFPGVPVTFDRYHLMQNLNLAVDLVRRAEQSHGSGLKRSRYLWLKNPSKLSGGQQAELQRLSRIYTKTARAYQIKLAFQEFWEQPPEAAEAYLERWYSWAVRTRLEPIKAFAFSIDEHWAGVLRWFTSKVSNGILEAISSLVQAAKRRARGYRTSRNLIAMVYLIAGKLTFEQAT